MAADRSSLRNVHRRQNPDTARAMKVGVRQSRLSTLRAKEILKRQTRDPDAAPQLDMPRRALEVAPV
jgi:hypothetical protein